jgi:3-(3-hydroxy-phenyl)propionate hydroxylase
MPEDRRPAGAESGRSVVIVGAGPAGLAAALGLRSLGHAPTVLEADREDEVRHGSRALFLHRESLRLLERMSPGLGHEIAAHGLTWRTRRTLYRSRQVFARTYPDGGGEPFPPFVSLRQPDTERFLRAACLAAGVEIVWSSPVKAAWSTGAKALVETEAGNRWQADYIVAAEGSRSATRRALGLEMRGARSQSIHVVVDLDEDAADPMPVERIFHYRHPALAGRNVLLIPFAGGWQIDVQCKPGGDPAELTGGDAVHVWVPRVVAPKYAERIAWVSTYRFHQAVAECFTDGSRRFVIIGDAAHLFAPFGARGMNSAIADAHAAAGAIATALAATNDERARGAIEDFDRVRRAAARHNEQAVSAALAHLHPQRSLLRLRQLIAARLAPKVDRLGAWLDEAPYGPRALPSTNPLGRY